ncbi:MAG: helix-turn-helix transcriptional regulator [Bacteroidales bacterium]|nr:helix-turn-helix transcriptional regulator [Bacteroidales bacterium]
MEDEEKEILRIQEIMQSEQLNASAFADMIGVQRSSVSHVVSGRNKASKEFMVKILKTFPNISSDWLFLGIGNMYRQEKEAPIFNQQESTQPIQGQTTINFDNQINNQNQNIQTINKPVQQKNTKSTQTELNFESKKETKVEPKKVEPKIVEPEKTETTNIENNTKISESEPVNIMKTDPEKIIVFYSNKTFTLYSPSGE